MPLLAPRAHFNSGDGIRMAQELGADFSGEPDGMHIEPVDPRSEQPGGGRAALSLRHRGRPRAAAASSTRARASCTRPGRRSRGACISRCRAAWPSRSSTPASAPSPTGSAPRAPRCRRIEAATLAELAKLIGVDADALARTVADYNAACTGDPQKFDATVCDGLAASSSLAPPKSNWARAIVEPPFLAWPIIGAIAYTFGGLATDSRARVLRGGAPIPGLFAAGEITGHFYGTAPNAVSVLRAFVFGRIAGREAVGSLFP